MDLELDRSFDQKRDSQLLLGLQLGSVSQHIPQSHSAGKAREEPLASVRAPFQAHCSVEGAPAHKRVDSFAHLSELLVKGAVQSSARRGQVRGENLGLRRVVHCQAQWSAVAADGASDGAQDSIGRTQDRFGFVCSHVPPEGHEC